MSFLLYKTICRTPSISALSDVAALYAAITDLVKDPTRREEMGVNYRRIAVEEYSLELQARWYSELYKTDLSNIILSCGRVIKDSKLGYQTIVA